jgi:hypothetical protein
LKQDPHVEAFAWVETNITGKVESLTMNMEVISPLQGDLRPGILKGRIPLADDEIALGSTTMRKLHAHIGGTVMASAIGASSPLLPARVVGQAVLEPGEIAGHLGEGAVITSGGKVHFASGATTTPPFVIGVRYRYGANRAASEHALESRLVNIDAGFGGNVSGPATPTDMVDFGHVSYLPFAFGAIVAGIALLTVVHLLVTSIRRRRRDIAVLKTLGFVRRQVSRTIGWQATTLAFTAVLFGVPLGVVAGRWAWTALARQLGVQPEPVTPVALVLLVAPAMLLVAKVVSLVPARFAARTRPALVLRSE